VAGGGAVSRVLGVGDAGGPRKRVTSCSWLSSGPNFCGTGESTSTSLSQWNLLDTGRSPARYWSIASWKELSDWSPGSAEDGADAGLVGGLVVGLGGGALRDVLDSAVLGCGLAA
jgi:hypothetical protein